MNDVIKTLLTHRSIRDYKSDEVSDIMLDNILKAAQSAPSSINGQQMSIIIVREEKRKAKLSELSGNQKWINQAPVFLIFCQDFYRAKLAADKNNVDLKVVDTIDATLIGSIDVGLAMGNAIATAESLGLGTVPIGAIRNEPLEVAKLLNLPDYVFPLCGLVIGHPNDPSAVKPRLPKEAVVFNEFYNHDLKHLIDTYDETMSDYMLKRTNGESKRNWTTGISNFYKNESSRKSNQAMKDKGFLNE